MAAQASEPRIRSLPFLLLAALPLELFGIGGVAVDPRLEPIATADDRTVHPVHVGAMLCRGAVLERVRHARLADRAEGLRGLELRREAHAHLAAGRDPASAREAHAHLAGG